MNVRLNIKFGGLAEGTSVYDLLSMLYMFFDAIWVLAEVSVRYGCTGCRVCISYMSHFKVEGAGLQQVFYCLTASTARVLLCMAYMLHVTLQSPWIFVRLVGQMETSISLVKVTVHCKSSRLT